MTFIKESQEQNRVDILCVGLFALSDESLQAAAADSLCALADPTGARCLLFRLQQARSVVDGDAEPRESSQLVRRSVIAALNAITGIDIAPAIDADAATDEFIDRVENWISKQQR